jgi:TPR repeat protein
MARKTRLTPSGEQIVEAIDNGSEFIPYRRRSSIAAKGDYLPDDPTSLFLSSRADEPKQPGFGRGGRRTIISSPTLKASMLAAGAASIVFTMLSMEKPLALFANAKASLVSISAAPSSADPLRPAIQSAAPVRDVSPSATGAPTRDEIIAAFKSAHQSQADLGRPPAAAAPARRLDADELAGLLKRAKNLIAIGDIVSARLLLERAADAQEASAALLLAQTYDPAVLGTPDARSITPDPAMARGWYQKAARFGSVDAQRRLDQMRN